MSDDESTKVTITLRTIVTGPEAGCIIGRGGEIVNSIRDESGAKIKIEGSSQQERIITVDGPTDSIFKVTGVEDWWSVSCYWWSLPGLHSHLQDPGGEREEGGPRQVPRQQGGQ